jgi:hypothetical protein
MPTIKIKRINETGASSTQGRDKKCIQTSGQRIRMETTWKNEAYVRILKKYGGSVCTGII